MNGMSFIWQMTNIGKFCTKLVQNYKSLKIRIL